jgi:hypothetical protein
MLETLANGVPSSHLPVINVSGQSETRSELP